MISPSYEEFVSLRPYLVVRSDGTISFKHEINKFYTDKFARLNFERRITWPEFQASYMDIICMLVDSTLDI